MLDTSFNNLYYELMRNYKQIEFKCLGENCGKPVIFKLQEMAEKAVVRCPRCSKEYNFNGNFVDKLKKFDRLISAIKDARDILGDTNVAVNFKNQEVRVPYRLLLTRMNTLLTISVGNQKIEFRFRVEPLSDTEPDPRGK